MSQIQETYQTLAEIDKLLASIELKVTKLETSAPAMKRNLETFREVERLAIRWLVAARRMGLPENLEAAADKIARIVTSIRMLQISMNLMLSTNPLTAAIGIGGFIGSVYTFSDSLVGY